eukprot:GILI01004056.1.p1 GENE.GILI01004056.1~~GILI01004056.1.p1  ORF type:complete len:270 (+),score=91.16 GILI01004056.1:66-812(+)
MKRNVLILSVCFLVGLSLVGLLFYNFPEISAEDKAKLTFYFPRSPEQLRVVRDLLANYTTDYYWFVVAGFCATYVFLQMFAIPGPIFLSVLSGALFGGPVGFALVCLCATFGASACYGMSYLLGNGLVQKFFSHIFVPFREKVQQQRESLFFYMLFLRITPLLPNWFINISSPLVGVPFSYFFFATLFGLMPGNIITVRMGLTLGNLDRIGPDFQTILSLFGIGLIALLPTLIKNKLGSKFDKTEKIQ